MPANPGAKRNQEKAKKKRDAARKVRQEANARAKARAPQVPVEQPLAEGEVPSPFDGGSHDADFDALDELAEEVAKLLKAKKVDEAQRKSAEIVRRFPNEPDGWQGFSRVHEARGDLPKALAEMERAAERASAEDDVTTAKIAKDLARLRAAVAKQAR